MDTKTEQIFIINTTEAQALIGPQNSAETTQANLQNVLTSNVCRTCAAATEFIIPIFHGEGIQNNLAEKIHKHLPIQVSEQDELPQVVCYQCASTLLAWHELVQCCVQADKALRTSLAVGKAHTHTQEAQPGTSNDISGAPTQQEQDKDKEKNKFIEISDYVIELEPPQYSPRAETIACPYCAAAHGGRAAHTDHLVAAHAELLFHCDECDQYVDRKDLILHMTMHAVQYSLNDKQNTEQTDKDPPPAGVPAHTELGAPTKKQKKTKKKIEEEASQKDAKPIKVESPQEITVQAEAKTEVKGDSISSKEASDFSDHTDTEDGFGPLPESVFEAIEDSQDSQPETPSEPQVKQKESKAKNKKWARACPYCSKVYTASSSYFYHIRYSHKGIKEHECDVCKRKFATKASVKQHMLTHNEELPYECTECGKKFRSNASLYIHSQTHGSLKRFICGSCGKGFRWKQLMLRHEQRHAEARNHPCGSCGRAFRVRCDMLRHARTHSAEAHACHKCGRQFAQVRYLKVHMDKKHSASIPAEMEINQEVQ